ncbi:MAG: endonuclease/exonuclease/phosphatase family protein [Bryobacteraceae bacterium]|jgi:endonuclease/exonuclease/phosphatase family metal-dependent hydrolase
MKDILTGSFTGWRWFLRSPDAVRVIDWNIERGLQLPRILDFLASQDADILTLQEVDLNARRTGKRNVAEEIARKLKLDYAFGREFEELAEGSRGSPAYTGQATLSRWPINRSRVIRFGAQSNFWSPKWYRPKLPVFQERLGGRIALVNEIDVGGRSLAIFNVHLESRGEDQLRLAQLGETLSGAAQYASTRPVIIAGDMNLDISHITGGQAIRGTGFHDAVVVPGAATTIRKGLRSGRSIDSILVRNGFRSGEGRIHNRVRASDHFPLSCAISLIAKAE